MSEVITPVFTSVPDAAPAPVRDAVTPQGTVSPEVVTPPAAPPVAAPPPVEAKKHDDKMASRMTVLTRKEQKIQEEKRSVAAERAEVARLKAEVAARDEAFAAAKTDPMKALQMLGLSYSEFLAIAMNNGTVTPEVSIRRLEERQAAFEQEQRDRIAQQQEQEQQALASAEAQAVVEFRGQIAQEVADPAKYPLINHYGQEATDFVFKVIVDHHTKTKKIASIQETAKLVEDYLLEEAKKLQEKVAPPPPPKPPQVATKTPPHWTAVPEHKPTTLTNSVSPPVSSRPRSSQVTTTREEDIKRVLAKFGGK